MLDEFTKPYQIPYRIMVPKEVDGLLVPVAASTTHVDFSTIRLEPTWMAMGQAAGIAAHLAIKSDRQPRHVAIDRLQRLLLDDGQVISYFSDIDAAHPAFKASQYFGAKGFFADYGLRADEPVTQADAARWFRIAFDDTTIVAEERAEDSQKLLDHTGLRNKLQAIAKRVVKPLPEELLPNRGQRPVMRGELCRILYTWLAPLD